jgi:hypothetical protein
MLSEEERRRIEAQVKAARIAPVPPPEPLPPEKPRDQVLEVLIITFPSNPRLRAALEEHFRGHPTVRVIEDRRVRERRSRERWGRWRERRVRERRLPLYMTGFVGSARFREDGG